MQYRGFPSYYENFLVCNYGPSANIYKQPVYDIANNTCNCPCIGCNPNTGMCPLNCKLRTKLRNPTDIIHSVDMRMRILNSP